MKNRTDLINYIIQKLNFTSYLELGTYSKDLNFNNIKCDKKVCLDINPDSKPDIVMSTDEYFRIFDRQNWDCIFIDADHEAGQVTKDLKNAWSCLNTKGIIIMHDCNPPTEATTCIPRGSQREWCGNVHRVAARIAWPYKYTVDFDYGCLMLRKNHDNDPLKLSENWDYPWTLFDQNRKDWLNLKSVDESIQIINSWT